MFINNYKTSIYSNYSTLHYVMIRYINNYQRRALYVTYPMKSTSYARGRVTVVYCISIYYILLYYIIILLLLLLLLNRFSDFML